LLRGAFLSYEYYYLREGLQLRVESGIIYGDSDIEVFKGAFTVLIAYFVIY
jgi:hypothetical protein